MVSATVLGETDHVGAVADSFAVGLVPMAVQHEFGLGAADGLVVTTDQIAAHLLDSVSGWNTDTWERSAWDPNVIGKTGECGLGSTRSY